MKLLYYFFPCSGEHVGEITLLFFCSCPGEHVPHTLLHLLPRPGGGAVPPPPLCGAVRVYQDCEEVGRAIIRKLIFVL